MSGQSDKKFTNPILAGFYPDPSICRVGSDYYLVNSTFSYFPGITVFQSKDLVHWRLIGHILDRPEQLNLDGQGVSRGIFAPSIRYHDGTYYVTCTQVDRGGNFIVTAKKPEGPWSNPIWIPEINGIDPSMFFDENARLPDGQGKAYILYNSIPPDDKPLYDGHRTLRMYEFDLAKMKVVGNECILVNGGVDISKKPVWIEGPHILQKDGWYYLIAAEGGTAEWHSTQRHLDPNRKFPITSTGHADFVQTKNGDWWSVFLGCRPYEEGYYNIAGVFTDTT
jgi:alpha-N-arabinofuranosidase